VKGKIARARCCAGRSWFLTVTRRGIDRAVVPAYR